MNPIRIAICGATGRMGGAIVRLASADAGFSIVAGLTREEDPLLGHDIGKLAGVEALGVLASERCDVACDVLVDFSAPAAAAQWARWCGERGVAMVSGTTGIGGAELEALKEAAGRVAVCWSANMSVGVNLLAELVGDAVRALGRGWDIEIVEAHHRNKLDAPSGTARMLLEEAAGARGVDARAAMKAGRSGADTRRGEGEIGVHALRMGSVVGEHSVYLAGEGEVITLSHSAQSRDVFAAGALRAARWVAGRAAGFYHMRDVLRSGDK